METLKAWLEQAKPVIESPWAQAAAVVVAAVIVAKLADWILTRVLKAWARRSVTEVDDQLIDLIHRPIFYTVLIIGLLYALRLLGPPEGLALALNRALKTLAIIIWVLFALRFVSLVLQVLSSVRDRFQFLEQRTVTLFDNLSKLLIVGTAVYGVFLIWGIDVGGILVGAGVLGIAIGFAAKDTLANLFSGIFILADAPYQVGDFVVLASGERGQVTRVGLRSTRLLTRDDIEVTVPNAVIANAKIVNENGGRWEMERVRVKVGVAYGSDIDEVRELLLTIAEANPLLVEHPKPRVRFRAFGDSALELELLGWIEEPVLRGRVLDALYTEVYKALNREGIEIPFPKRDVYLHQAETPAPAD